MPGLAGPLVLTSFFGPHRLLHCGMPVFKWPRITLPFGVLVGFNVPIAPANLLLTQFRISGIIVSRSSALCPYG